ncbi:MAG: tricorn protease [Planctomycetota bacterium]|jgi:tricorn protease
MRFILSFLLLGLSTQFVSGQELARLLRFPHMQGEKVAFVHGGDIWVCTRGKLEARRLTSFDEGFEVMPRISPDGEWVAFSGEYAGSRQIYVVPWKGGVPKQLTFYPDVGPMPARGGYDNLPYDWTADGKKILVRSNRTSHGQRVGRYFLVDASGQGLPEPLAIPEGGAATFSPDGKSLTYNIISREWRTWKRYTAGRSQDVYTFDLATNQVKRLTSYSGTDNQPLWLGNKIYFTSDRTGTLNLWSHDLSNGKESAITNSKDFDVLFPSRGRNGIIFESGGYLHVMDAQTEQVEQLKVVLADDKPWTRSVWKDGKSSFSSFDLSPTGKRIVVDYRGDLFTAPAKRGVVRRLELAPNRRERDPDWSPDGKYIAYLAESGDNYELFLYDRETKTERALTQNSPAWIQNFVFSPDAKQIAFTDKESQLRIVDVESGVVSDLDSGREGGIRSFSWSADSSHVTYTKGERSGLSSIWVAHPASQKKTRVTKAEFADSGSTFGPEGKYLYFVSARDFNYGDRNFDRRIYALVLQKGEESPLAFVSDEEPLPKKEDDKESSTPKSTEKADKDAKQGDAKLKIDFDGIEDRVVVLPLKPGSYRGLSALKSGLLYLDADGIKLFDFDKRESKSILKGTRGFGLSADRKQLGYRHRGKICIAKVTPGQKAGSGAVDLTGVQVKIDPVKEWQQMFDDAWRITRDWFYDSKMHRVDWQEMKKKYEPLLAHMSHRSDLDYILGELIGELNVGHAYVQTGELPAVDRYQTGCLGCEFVVNQGRYRISKIFASENWTKNGRNPLTEVGVRAKVGEYLLAIDGEDLSRESNPYQFLEGKVGRRVTITLASGPDGAGSHEEIVKPISSETQLRYLDWITRNAKLVAKMSQGRIGYIHVPNTAVEGHRRFYEGMYAMAQDKEALIVDDRYNGGGFIPDRMAHDLAAKPLNYWARRGSELYSTPSRAFHGPSVMLINGYSSSGGDAFPYYYRKLGVGPLIGAKTWGGLVGISFEPGLVDGGRIRVPSFAFVDTDGKWAVEAEGVSPDLEVFDDPGRIIAGEEPILEAGVAHLMEILKSGKHNKRPAVPEGPARNK